MYYYCVLILQGTELEYLKGCSQVAAAITAEEYDGAALLLAAETPGALEALGAKPLEQVRIKRAIAGAVAAQCSAAAACGPDRTGSTINGCGRSVPGIDVGILLVP